MAALPLSLLLLSLVGPDRLERRFTTPPPEARPWVYWYFMEGQMTREGLTADLEAMRKAVPLTKAECRRLVCVPFQTRHPDETYCRTWQPRRTIPQHAA